MGVPHFNSARDLYNYAFSLINQAQYPKAGEALEAFIERHPGDALTGHVYYWLGETWYVREDFPQAAESFRKGFEAMPDGVKAPDNLLKLAKSLDVLGKKKQACIVLSQLLVKFEGGNAVLLQKAQAERNRMQCSN